MKREELEQHRKYIRGEGETLPDFPGLARVAEALLEEVEAMRDDVQMRHSLAELGVRRYEEQEGHGARVMQAFNGGRCTVLEAMAERFAIPLVENVTPPEPGVESAACISDSSQVKT